MSEKTPAPPRRSGCLGVIGYTAMLLIVLGLIAVLITAFLPQQLDDIDGYGEKSGTSRDLKVVMQNSLDRDYPLTLTEEEINGYLAKTLKLQQGGALAQSAKLSGIWVRLEDGRAEVVLERKIFGRTQTVSMYLQVERMEQPDGTLVTEISRHGGAMFPNFAPKPRLGGRIGRLSIPEGYLRLVLPAFEQVAAALSQESDLALQRMSRVRIENNKLILQPSPEQNPAEGVLPTF